MADLKTRAASLYIDNTKAAQMEGTTYDWTGNDEAQIGDGGYLGHSDGAVTTRVTCNGIMPLAGTNIDFYDIAKKKKVVTVMLTLVNGKIHVIRMRLTSISIRSSHRSGTQTGDFTFEGGEPEIK